LEYDIIIQFLGIYVKLVKQEPSDTRPFKLFGTITNVTDDTLVLKTEQGLGAIRLCDIHSIVQWRKNDQYQYNQS